MLCDSITALSAEHYHWRKVESIRDLQSRKPWNYTYDIHSFFLAFPKISISEFVIRWQGFRAITSYRRTHISMGYKHVITSWGSWYKAAIPFQCCKTRSCPPPTFHWFQRLIALSCRLSSAASFLHSCRIEVGVWTHTTYINAVPPHGVWSPLANWLG